MEDIGDETAVTGAVCVEPFNVEGVTPSVEGERIRQEDGMNEVTCHRGES